MLSSNRPSFTCLVCDGETLTANITSKMKHVYPPFYSHSSSSFTSDRHVFPLLCYYGNANLLRRVTASQTKWSQASTCQRKSPIGQSGSLCRPMLKRVMFWSQRTRTGQILENGIVADGFMAFYTLATRYSISQVYCCYYYSVFHHILSFFC